MTQQVRRSDLQFLRYANTVRAHSRRGLGIAVIATFFVTCAIIDAFASPPVSTYSDWPSRTVKIIVPFPAGSADDVAARIYAEGLSQRWIRPAESGQCHPGYDPS